MYFKITATSTNLKQCQIMDGFSDKAGRQSDIKC